MKDAIELHYGKGRIRCFWSLTQIKISQPLLPLCLVNPPTGAILLECLIKFSQWIQQTGIMPGEKAGANIEIITSLTEWHSSANPVFIAIICYTFVFPYSQNPKNICSSMALEDINTKRYTETDKQTARQQIIDRAHRGGAGSQQEAETDRSPLPDRRTALSVSSFSAAINNLLPFIPQLSVLPVNL